MTKEEKKALEDWNKAKTEAFNAAAHALEEARTLFELKDTRPLPRRICNPFKRPAAEKAYEAAKKAEQAELAAAMTLRKRENEMSIDFDYIHKKLNLLP